MPFGETKYLSERNVVVPEEINGLTVKVLGRSVFSYSNILSIVLPPSLETMMWHGFYNCDDLSSITIPSGVKDWSFGRGNYAGGVFSACDRLTSVVISDGVTEVGEKEFECCGGLDNVSIPRSVTTIRERAFADSGVTEIHIPDSVQDIGSFAFYSCGSLTEVTIDSETVANALVNSRSQEYLVLHAQLIYIKSNITSVGEYVTSNFTKQATSDKAGYDKYVKNE